MSTSSPVTVPPGTGSGRPADPTRSPGRQRWWAPASLAGICALSAVLYLWGVGTAGWGNPYYAAAVKAMSGDVTAFLFGSFDASDVVTVDKPPMALWPQVVSVWIFGWHGWAVLLPQAVEGVAAVVVLHRTVRMWWTGGGSIGGPPRTVLSAEGVPLLAALVLALTPVTVAVYRANNTDPLMVLFVVAAAYCLTRAVRRGSTWWLVAAASAVGCGFVTKMLAAWMVVPALGAAFLLAGPGRWRRRVGQLLVAGVALVVTSFWWPVMVALWPSPKPWIGGSADGSVWNLVLGHNGLQRLFGDSDSTGAAQGAGGGPSGGSGGGAGMSAAFGGGSPGPARLFGQGVGTQISWLLPLCLVALVVAAVVGVSLLRAARLSVATGQDGGQENGGREDGAERQALAGWLLWGGWLVVVGGVFSFSGGLFHPYYTSELAPAVAALSAVGGALLWRLHRAGGVAAWLLPGTVAVSAVWAWVLAARTPGWNGWVGPTVLVVGALGVAGLLAGSLVRRGSGPGTDRVRRLARTAVVVSAVALLVGPGAWSIGTAFGGTTSVINGLLPVAGPSSVDTGSVENSLSGMSVSGRLAPEQQRMLAYVEQNSSGVPFTLTVESALTAAPYVIGSGITVVGMGGFIGADPAPSVAQLAQWVDSGRARFVLVPAGSSDGPAPAVGSPDRTTWVTQHCAPVDPQAWGATAQPGASALYRCGP